MRTLLAVAVLAITAAPVVAAVLSHSPIGGSCGTQRIAFTAHGIAVAGLDGRTRTQVTRGAHDAYPEWSPDGSWIAFLHLRNEDAHAGELWVVHPDGSDRHRLVNAQVYSITWRGRRVYFETPQRPYTVSPDGAPIWVDARFGRLAPDGRRIASIELDDTGHEEGLIVDGQELVPGGIGNYLWSPDGTRIAFDWNGSNVSVVNVRTGVIRPLTRWTGYNRFDAISAPSVAGWSPDGSAVTTIGPGGDAYVLDARHRAVHRVTHFNLATDSPEMQDDGWSADGRWIAIELWNPMNALARIYAVHPNGRGLRLLASGSQATWSPCTA